jgi:hypothetical protein
VLPRGQISGLYCGNNSGDTAHDLDISAGTCRDSTNACDLTLSSAFVKKFDTVWAAGTGNGGMASGVTMGASTLYHVFIIKKDSDGTIDIVGDSSEICANIPAGYTYYRRIFSFVTDSSSNIQDFVRKGSWYWYTDPLLDVNVSDLGSAYTAYTLNCPCLTYGSITILANATITNGSGVVGLHVVPSAGVATQQVFMISSPATSVAGAVQLTMSIGTTSQIKAYASAASSTLTFSTNAWYDDRSL